MGRMKAIVITQPGGPEALQLVTVDTPGCPAGHVLIRVVAAGINRADVLQRQGHYTPPPGASPYPGLEVSGVITRVGEGVSPNEWSEGDRVAALLTGGGYAEYVAVPAGQLLAIPDSLSFTDAAALPEVLCTVYSNVFQAARLRADEWLLVHGGGSGIGTAAVQMAVAAGARVIVTVGSQAKGDVAVKLGAEAAVNYREEDFVERVREITGGHGADVILDVIGAKYLDRNLHALADDGRLTIIGMQGGVRAELDIAYLMTRRLSVAGTTLRARPAAQKAQIVQAVANDVWPLVATGSIRAIVDSVHPLADAAAAQAKLDEGSNTGKVVLSVAPLIGQHTASSALPASSEQSGS